MQTNEPQRPSIWEFHIHPAVVGFICLLIGITGYILWPRMTRLPTMDENIMIYEGFSVAMGKLPYRDFFDFIWPGTFYLIAALHKIYGPSLFALRAFVLLCLFVCTFTTIRLGQLFLPAKWLLLLGGLFYLFNIPATLQVGHHLFSATAGLLSVWQLSLFVSHSLSGNQKEKMHLILAALFCGLSFCFTQSLGICLLLSSLVFLFFYLSHTTANTTSANIKTLLLFASIAVSPALMVILWFTSIGAGQTFFYSTFGWLLEGTYQKTTDSWYFKEGFQQITESNGLNTTAVLILEGALPILGLLWPLDIFYRRNKQNKTYRPADWQLLLLWLSSLGFMAPIFSYPSTLMIVYHAWIPYLLAIVILFTLFKNKPRIEIALMVSVLVLICLHISRQLYVSSQIMQCKKLISYGTVEKELFPPNRTQNELTTQYNRLTYWIHQYSEPGAELFVYNLAPELYLLTDRQNPTRYNYLMAIYNTPRQIQEAADSLSIKHPKFIIYNHLDSFFFTLDFRFARFRHYDYHLKPIERVLGSHYRLLTKAGALWLYEYTQ